MQNEQQNKKKQVREGLRERKKEMGVTDGGEISYSGDNLRCVNKNTVQLISFPLKKRSASPQRMKTDLMITDGFYISINAKPAINCFSSFQPVWDSFYFIL